MSVAAIVMFSPPFYSGGERGRQRERQPAEQSASRRLQRKRRQGVVEVRLAEAGDSQSRGDGISSQPDETELIASGEQNHGGSGGRDIGKEPSGAVGFAKISPGSAELIRDRAHVNFRRGALMMRSK
jgi:hypothetical protein